MNENLMQHMQDIEREHGVRVVFAVLAGSRAWGLAHPESDYDVRFVYVRPMAAYLQLERQEDSLTTRHRDIESHGWDLRKALGLLHNSNYSAIELFSHDDPFICSPEFDQVHLLVQEHYDALRVTHAYRGLGGDALVRYAKAEERIATKYLAEAVRMALSLICLRRYGKQPYFDVRPLMDLAWNDLPKVIYKECEALFTARRNREIHRGSAAFMTWLNTVFGFTDPLKRGGGRTQFDPSETSTTGLNALLRQVILGDPMDALSFGAVQYIPDPVSRLEVDDAPTFCVKHRGA